MFTLEEISLKSQKEEIKTFLKKFNLEYENDIDYTIAVYYDGIIVATASKAKNVLKCFAIHEKHQGQGLTTSLVKKIEDRMFQEGLYHFFIYTPDKNKEIFRSIGYQEIISTFGITILENGNQSIHRFLGKISKNISKNEKACIIMNANPFTLGHRYLIEKAAEENKEVCVFVVSEDKSAFPFDVRFRLVKEGTKDLENVSIYPTGPYLISNATFPTYFLKKGTDVEQLQTRIDSMIFVKYYKEMFHINKRYIGNEPYCPITRAYNKAMQEILPSYGVEVVLVNRKSTHDDIISASKVRQFLARNQFELVKQMVPKTTYDFLVSEEAVEIINKLKTSTNRH